MFKDTIVLSKRRVLAEASEVDELKRIVGVSAPAGYRDFVCCLGRGEYSDFLWVLMPDEILANYEAERLSKAETFVHFYLHWGPQPIGVSDVAQSVEYARSNQGDSFLVCPAHPGKMFWLPRHSSNVKLLEVGFADPLTVVKSCFEGVPGSHYDYFMPWSPDQTNVTFRYETRSWAHMVADRFETSFAAGRIIRDSRVEDTRFGEVLMIESLHAVIGIERDERRRMQISATIDADQVSELKSFLAGLSGPLEMTPL